ncbi:MAG TPA: alpha/beta fold hydrolase [Streptosporangiaceae bacterium]|nr:alpha/beta fold hydrolase [Streptosporangiaceae bacterium]
MTSVRGVVVVAHGGQSVSNEPTTAYQLAVLRMIPLVAAIRHAVRGRGVVVRRPRFEVRGWNDANASPVRDLTRLLDDLRGEFGPVPVVLVGHSMGARAALRAAGHPSVTAAAGLAPWLPPGEPVDQLAGRRILLAHGTADAVTSPADTWAYAERARALTSVTEIEVRTGEHTMLWRAPLWHGLAAAFTCLSLGLPTPSGAAAVAVTDARPPQRTVV